VHERYAFITKQKKAYPITVLCEVMQVSKSGYHRSLNKNQDLKEQKEQQLIFEAQVIAQESRNSYGKRRMAKALQAQGFPVGIYAAKTIMKKANIVCRQRKKRKFVNANSQALAAAPNLLKRQFYATAPNRIWLTDITYISTKEGWVYAAAVLDTFSRKIIGWAINDHMRESLPTEALNMALQLRKPEANFLHHSDQGIQYVSSNYQSTLKVFNAQISMSNRGNCLDNAVMERFWGSLKSEYLDHVVYQTKEAAKRDVIDYIESFYNPTRLHSALNYVSPNQFELQFGVTKVSTLT
jgi:putative transposase